MHITHDHPNTPTGTIHKVADQGPKITTNTTNGAQISPLQTSLHASTYLPETVGQRAHSTWARGPIETEQLAQLTGHWPTTTWSKRLKEARAEGSLTPTAPLLEGTVAQERAGSQIPSAEKNFYKSSRSEFHSLATSPHMAAPYSPHVSDNFANPLLSLPQNEQLFVSGRDKYLQIYARSRFFHQSYPAQFLTLSESLAHLQDRDLTKGTIGGQNSELKISTPVSSYLSLLEDETPTVTTGGASAASGSAIGEEVEVALHNADKNCGMAEKRLDCDIRDTVSSVLEGVDENSATGIIKGYAVYLSSFASLFGSVSELVEGINGTASSLSSTNVTVGDGRSWMASGGNPETSSPTGGFLADIDSSPAAQSSFLPAGTPGRISESLYSKFGLSSPFSRTVYHVPDYDATGVLVGEQADPLPAEHAVSAVAANWSYVQNASLPLRDAGVSAVPPSKKQLLFQTAQVRLEDRTSALGKELLRLSGKSGEQMTAWEATYSTSSGTSPEEISDVARATRERNSPYNNQEYLFFKQPAMKFVTTLALPDETSLSMGTMLTEYGTEFDTLVVFPLRERSPDEAAQLAAKGSLSQLAAWDRWRNATADNYLPFADWRSSPDEFSAEEKQWLLETHYSRQVGFAVKVTDVDRNSLVFQVREIPGNSLVFQVPPARLFYTITLSAYNSSPIAHYSRQVGFARKITRETVLILSLFQILMSKSRSWNRNSLVRFQQPCRADRIA